jgi:CheY-like chemotaxis protein
LIEASLDPLVTINLEGKKCLASGMNNYISKPINANLLFEKIYDLIINS